MKALLNRIGSGEIIVADGAMGTMLFRHGLPTDQCPESYNLSHPEILTSIASEYLNAGAEIIQTNTFGGSPLKLEKYGLDQQTEEINRRAVEIVHAVVDDRAYVSGSIGPSGRILIPYGDTDPERIYESALRQASALIAAGVDLICVETMTDITEATLNIKAVKSLAPDLPVMATMTFDRTPRGFFTMMGVTIEKAAQELEKAGAEIIGSNCGCGIEMMIKIALEFRAHSQRPLIIQANAGLPEIEDDHPVYRETPEFMAEKGRELVAAGVSIIGGCCGTTPEHIAAMRRMVDSLSLD
jgi:5-methyltetrahydrofolate--homocysteine methyltransferase